MSSDEPQRITFDVFKSAAASEFYNRITISDDHSSGSTVERRKLLALGKITNSDEYRSARSDNSLTSPFPSDPWEFPVHESGSSFHMEKAADRMTAVSTPSTETGAAAASQVALMTHKTTDAMEIPTVLMDLRNVLQGASISQLHLQKLQDYIAFLQSNNQRGGVEKKQPSFRHQIFYRIWESVGDPSKNDDTLEDQLSVPYFDHPVWARGDGRASRMRCEIPLENFELYLEKNKDVAFIVYRDFQTGSMDNAASYPVTHLPRHSSEKIQPINRDLITAIVDLLSSRDEYAKLLEMYLESNKLPAPYLFIYHSRTSLEEFQDGLTLPAKTQLSLLSKYVTEQFAHEYAAADDLLSQNKILPEYVHYLFKPGDLLVSKVGNEYTGHVATSWPQVRESKRELRMPFTGSRNCKEPRPDGVKDDASAHKMRSSIRAWHWEFDGNFQRRFETLELEILDSENRCGNATNTEGVEKESRESNPQARATKISDLNVFPVQYASLEITEKCRRRGKNFWNCRHRRYVSYQESEVGNFHSTYERYMIDLKTYHRLHPYQSTSLEDELGPDAMARDEPPDEKFELLLPLKIKGYNLRRKKWFDLVADRIVDVIWNKEAFRSLVIDRKAGDLIRALVSNQLAAEKGTDLIMGKGNGLILLLHGGPGTGKTLTAESVAEMAEKPLYRVTCGDVGTKADEVEKYLESVLHLGKIWGCVVLLDEADVFLEQRSLEDLERNALVSVFLRVLEYYEGILVLTSNRVGTFDEAFKSRIQLALHYPGLGPYQRLRIWENFINRLESFGDDGKVDIADLRDHLEDLKEEEMNGRQIRNAITTARQYAEWKGTTLTYAHLKDVIEVSGRFDKYLNKLNGGFTQDQIAQDEGFRLA